MKSNKLLCHKAVGGTNQHTSVSIGRLAIIWPFLSIAFDVLLLLLLLVLYVDTALSHLFRVKWKHVFNY
jgi:hypothetical protein